MFGAGLEREMVWLSALMPYQTAAQLLKRLTQVRLSDTTLWRQVQAAGGQVRIHNAERESARRSAPPAPEVGQIQMGATMDGVMVHIREEGWKELKLGCVCELVNEAGTPPRLGCAEDPQDSLKAHRQTFVWHLGGPEALGEKLQQEAQTRHWYRAAQTSVTADGAEWIWGLAEKHFPNSACIVNWYHAKAHLWEAARAVCQDEPAAAAWVSQHVALLYNGQARTLADRLEGLRQGEADIPRNAALRMQGTGA